MDYEMRMPDLATTGSPIKVVRWLVPAGQTVRRGDRLLEVETDKAVMDVESLVTGRLQRCVVAEGEEVSAGQVIAAFETDRVEAQSSPSALVAAATAEPRHVPPRPAAPPAPRSRGPSFFARNREARRRGHQAAIPLSVPRRVLARQMEKSKQTIPHFYLQTSTNAGPIAARRKAATEMGKPPVWDAYFVHAAARALQRFPRLGCRFEADTLVSQGVDAIGVAVDLDEELFTLVLESPADRPPEQLSDEILAGVARLRSGDPRARLARRANLTVSNLGSLNVESFAAVINPPESAILAVGKVIPVVTVVEGRVAVQERVNLTLSVDHRVVSGKYAAGFLGAIVEELESLRSDPEVVSVERTGE
jgi:pyruvate dehydrogenase E2 component (dihydrolipoamide acetyltransferase)